LGNRRYDFDIFLTEGRPPSAKRGAVVARVRFHLGSTEYSIAASVAPRRPRVR
jgi:hypothetical protein